MLKQITSSVLGVLLISSISLGKDGDHGPGGDFMIGTKVTKTQASDEVKGLKPYLVATFNHLEILLNLDVDFSPDAVALKAVKKKLFDGPQTIFDLLNKIQITPLTEGPCYDEYHRPRAGSVYHTKPNEFCLSIQRASEKLTTENLFSQLIGISVHELSHKMPANETRAENEAEAKAIQKLALTYVASTSKSTYYALNISVKNQMEELLKETTFLDRALSSGTNTDICNDLDNISESAKTLQGTLTNSLSIGLSPLRKADWVEGVVTASKVRFAKMYCLKPDYGVTRPSVEMSIPQAFNNGGPLYREYTGKLTVIGYHDDTTLKQVIHQMVDSEKMLLKNIADGDGTSTAPQTKVTESSTDNTSPYTCDVTKPGGQLPDGTEGHHIMLIEKYLSAIEGLYSEGDEWPHSAGSSYIVRKEVTPVEKEALAGEKNWQWSISTDYEESKKGRTVMQIYKEVLNSKETYPGMDMYGKPETQKVVYQVESHEFLPGEKMVVNDTATGIRIVCNVPK